MAHRVFTGSFEALESKLLAEIAGLQSCDPLEPVSVLVGSNVLAAHLKGRLAVAHGTAANIRFFTFLDLAAILARGDGPADNRLRVPALGPRVFLENLIGDGLPEVFQPVAEFRGFRASLLDTFRDLRDAGISADELGQSMKQLRRIAPDRAGSLAGLASLYGRFRAMVSQFRDVDDDFRSSVQAAWDAPRLMGSSSLLVYGVYDVTGQQADLLGGLAKSLHLICFVPYLGEQASGFVRPFLDSRIAQLKTAAEPLARPARDGSLHRLADRIFASPPGEGLETGPLTEDGSFSLVSVPGDSRAAVEIVREILRAVRDKVITGFHEAAVILRNPEADAPLLEEALRLRSIPAYVHGGSPFARHPLARAVKAIAGLEPGGFGRQAILQAMELASAALPPGRAAELDAPQWRALSNDARFHAGVETWDQATAALVRDARQAVYRTKDGAASDRAGGENDEGRLGLGPEEARRRLKAAEDLSHAWRLIRAAAADWPASLSWRRWASLLEERFRQLLGTSADWDALSMVLDEIGALGESASGGEDETPVSRRRLAAALEEALDSRRCPKGRFRRSGVNILSVTAARGIRFPLVIIPGLDEGKFPARLRQDPLLLDGERRRMGNPPRLALKSRRGEEERLLFDMAVRSAEKRLVLLTSRLDEGSDRESIPSEFFLRAAAAARGGHLSLRELTEENVPGFRSVSLERPAPAPGDVPVDRGEIRLRLVLSDRGRERAAVAALAAAESALLEGPLAYDRARWTENLTVFDGRIFDPALRAWVAARFGPAAGPVSASRIEDYARCPYLFFLRRVFGLRRWEEQEPAEGLDPLERGKIVHGILEAFLKAVPAGEFREVSEEDLWCRLEPVALEVLECARPAALADLIWELEVGRILRSLRNWVAYEKGRPAGELLPAGFEKAFGSIPGEQAGPDYVVHAGRHRFAFRGRIDRVDLAGGSRRARVIDYKTGLLPDSMSPSKRTPLMGGEKIQIAVYRGALGVLEEFADAETVEGEYLHLQPADGSVDARQFSHEELLEAQRRLSPMLEIIGDGIEQGIFFPRTRGSVNREWQCEHCDFLTVCGRDQGTREDRKAGDEAVVRFREIAIIDQQGSGEGE